MSEKFKCPGDYEIICIQIAQLLQEVFGKSFLEHMDKYDLWKLFDDELLMLALAELDIKETLEMFKGGMVDAEFEALLSRYIVSV